MNAALIWLLNWALGLLGKGTATFIQKLAAYRMDDPALYALITIKVREAESYDGVTVAKWTGTEKFAYVLDAALLWFKDFGIDAERALLDTLIQIIVAENTVPSLPAKGP